MWGLLDAYTYLQQSLDETIACYRQRLIDISWFMRILNEGIAVSAADIDLVLVHGYGFPRWRGGLMHYADQLGATLVMAELTKLCDEDPLFWQPSRLIINCAKTRRDFASYNDQSAKQPIL